MQSEEAIASAVRDEATEWSRAGTRATRRWCSSPPCGDHVKPNAIQFPTLAPDLLAAALFEQLAALPSSGRVGGLAMPNHHSTMAVGLFDILGFKDLMRKHEHQLEKLFKQIAATIEKVAETSRMRQYEGSARMGRLAFSDTIFLWIPTTAEYGGVDCVERMCVVASHLLSGFMEQKAPLRGAIAFGECLASCDPANPWMALLGMPVIEAYELERAQDWAGVALCKSAEEQAQTRQLWPATTCPFVQYPVPIKPPQPGRPSVHANMAIRYGLHPQFDDIRGLMRSNAVGRDSESISRKIDATATFYERFNPAAR